DEARAADADDDRPALAGEAQRAPASLEARHHRRHSMRTAEPPQASHGSSGCKDLPEIRCAPSGLGERFSAEHRGTVRALRVAGRVWPAHEGPSAPGGADRRWTGVDL